MKMTGELLRAERIKQDLKITDIAFALKLASKIIQSIEDGDTEALPAKTFTRGFVKSYAEFLKLDSVVVLRQFQEEMGSTSPMPKVPPPQPSQKIEKIKNESAKETPKVLDEKMSSGLTRQHIFIFIFIFVGVAIIALVNGLVRKYSRERADMTTQLILEKKNDPLYSKISSTDEASAQQITQLHMMNQTIPASTDVTAAAIENTEAVPAQQAEAINQSTEKTQYPSIDVSNNKPIEVLIEAKKDLTIQYAKGNSNTFEKILMKQNSYQIIRSNSGLHLRAEDGSHLILTVNGAVKPINKAKPLQITF